MGRPGGGRVLEDAGCVPCAMAERKPAAKKTAPPAKGKPAAKAVPAKPKTAAAKTLSKSKAPAGPALPRAMPPRPDAAALGAEPARATKPSARLAQITVPSMAQSVASTAAKASYTQTMSPFVLPPPPLVAIKKDPKLANNWKSKAVDQLSDAEVLAMPDSEYMNDKQMAFFRLKLTQLKQDILNSAGETTEHLREDTVIVPTRPTARPSKKNMRSNCARATASASCSRKSSSPSAASTRAIMGIATRPVSRSAWGACWLAPPPRSRWKRSSAVS